MIKVGIVGGTGYTGVELLRILAAHPEVELTAITSRKEDGMPVAEMFPSLRGHVSLAFSAPEKARLDQCDVVFFATPHGVAMAQAKELLAAGVKVIDLAADFRIKDTAVFEKWYGMPHSCPDILDEAVYGLAEVNREAIRSARVVGLAGCYPTTMQLGFAPLLAQGKPLVNESALIADCKSGVSGAGRKVGLTFVPHLVPMIRGIHSTLYATLRPEARDIDFQSLYEQHYANDPFVDVLPAGSHPETRSVRASNMLRIAIHRPGGGDLLVILVVEDNLVKGAAGQGVQCMNLMFGLNETTGLRHVPILP